MHRAERRSFVSHIDVTVLNNDRLDIVGLCCEQHGYRGGKDGKG